MNLILGGDGGFRIELPNANIVPVSGLVCVVIPPNMSVQVKRRKRGWEKLKSPPMEATTAQVLTRLKTAFQSLANYTTDVSAI